MTNPIHRPPNAAPQYQGIPPVPDRIFVRDLRTFDRKLSVQFDRYARRFVIVKEMPWGDPYMIWIVEDDFGGFRQPDQRDIKALYFADLWRHGGVKERVLAGERYAEDHKQKQEKEIDDTFRDATRDDALQLRRTFRQASNDGKANSEFRRVDTQGPGLTLPQIQEARSRGVDPWQTVT